LLTSIEVQRKKCGGISVVLISPEHYHSSYCFYSDISGNESKEIGLQGFRITMPIPKAGRKRKSQI
jgi:hypothetical protein